MPICITCKKKKKQDEMYFNSTLKTYRNICIMCRKDEVTQHNLKKAKTEIERENIQLKNILRKMLEALADRDSKKLRLWADVGKLEIGAYKEVEEKRQ